MTIKFDFGALEAPFEADWPVTVHVPQDGGEVQEQTFMARFRLLDTGQLEALQKSETLDAFVNSYWLGFGKTEERELDDGLREKMLGRPYIRRGLIDAYRKFMTGVPGKN